MRSQCKASATVLKILGAERSPKSGPSSTWLGEVGRVESGGTLTQYRLSTYRISILWATYYFLTRSHVIAHVGELTRELESGHVYSELFFKGKAH